MSRDSFFIYNDADEKLMQEVREIARQNNLKRTARFVITEKEMVERRRKGLPCDKFITLQQLNANERARHRAECEKKAEERKNNGQ